MLALILSVLSIVSAGITRKWNRSSSLNLDDDSGDDGDVAPSIPVIMAPEYPEPRPQPKIFKIIRIPPANYDPNMPVKRIIHVVRSPQAASVYNNPLFTQPDVVPSMILMRRYYRPGVSNGPMRVIKFIDSNNLWPN